MKLTVSTLLMLLTCFLSNAQIVTPSASPLATIKQRIGITDIELTYSRPSVNDREVFAADGLVPFGEFWRTGANSPTSIVISDDITIAGESLVKGEYVILTKPNASSWQILIYKKEKGGWSKYIDREPAASFNAVAAKSPNKMESLLIYFDDIKMKSADIIIHWDDIQVSIPVEVEVHDKVMASIDKVMKGPNDFDYFYAASYLYSVEQDMETALKYIQVASHGSNPTFFFARREATILAKLGRYKEAIAAAMRSNELGKKVGNIDVVKLNDQSIAEWKAKM